jgi:hypothetical protein
MAEQRQGFLLPGIGARHALPFMAQLSQCYALALACDLRFWVEKTGQLRLFLPHWEDSPRAGRDRVVELRNKLGDAYAEGAEQAYDLGRRGAQTENLDGSVTITTAAVLTLALGTDPATRDRNSRKLALLSGPADEIAEDLARILQRSRHSFVSSFQDESARQLTVVRLNDDSEEGATMDGLRALTRDALAILAANETPQGTIWLHEAAALPQESRVAAGEVLLGLKQADALPEDHDLVVFQQDEGSFFTTLPCNREEAPSADFLQDHAPQDLLSLRQLTHTPSEQALADLANRIVSREFPVGYKISLRPVPSHEKSEEDIEAIREEIAEREAEIDLIRALAAPQLRLLRFTDDQLPALIDGLRKMPPEMQRMAGLTYASANAAGHAGPIHYVLYDPGTVSLEGRVPEHYWRAKTQDCPIGYWLDPHAAAALNLDGSDPLVFVPNRQRLLPAINGFGGNLAQTLQLVLGNLFVDAAPILENPKAKPAFLFSPSEKDWAELDVELLDVNSFRPIHLSLKVLNDHLMVRSPRIADESKLRQLAEDLYEGQMAEQLTSEAAHRVSALEQVWNDGKEEIRTVIDETLEDLRKEIQFSRAQIRRSYDFLAAARSQIEELNAFVSQVNTIVSDANTLESQVLALPEVMRLDRYEAISTILSEIQLGHAAIHEAEAKLAENMERLAQLKAQLRQL